MLSPGLETLLKPQMMVLRIIWGAMMLAVVMYAIVGTLISQGPPVQIPPDIAMLRIVFGVLALVTGLLSLVVGRFIPSTSVIRQMLATEPDLKALGTHPRTGKPDAERSSILQSLSVPDRKLLMVAPLATTQAVVRFAFCEMPAIFGFILVTLTHQVTHYLPFGAFSLALLVVAKPRVDSFFERVSELGG